MCSEDEGVCHLPSYLLDSLTKFLREIVDPTIVRSKPMVLFVEGKFVKTLPSCLWVKKKCCDIVTWMILTFFKYILALKIHGIPGRKFSCIIIMILTQQQFHSMDVSFITALYYYIFIFRFMEWHLFSFQLKILFQ